MNIKLKLFHSILCMLIIISTPFIPSINADEDKIEFKVKEHIPVKIIITRDNIVAQFQNKSQIILDDIEDLPLTESKKDLFFFEDFNFDGYKDIAILTSQGMVNMFYSVFIYQPGNKNFIPLIFPEDLSLPEIITDKKMLISAQRSGPVWYRTIYKFYQGKPYIALSTFYHSNLLAILTNPQGDILNLVPFDHESSNTYLMNIKKSKYQHDFNGKVLSDQTQLFHQPNKNSPTKKYLKKGEKVRLLKYYNNPSGYEWFLIRTQGENMKENWIIAKDVEVLLPEKSGAISFVVQDNILVKLTIENKQVFALYAKKKQFLSHVFSGDQDDSNSEDISLSVSDDLLQVDDFNFDGYPDIAIWTELQGRVNQQFEVYIWDSKAKQFNYLEFGNDLSNIVLYSKEKLLASGYRSGPVWSRSLYRFRNGKPYESIFTTYHKDNERLVYLAILKDIQGNILNMVEYDPFKEDEDLLKIRKAPNNRAFFRKIIIPKAWFYDEPSDRSQSQSYLIKGDKVRLLSYRDGFYRIQYQGKRTIRKWIKEKAIYNMM